MKEERENKNVIRHWKNFASDVFWLFRIVWKKYSFVLILLFFTSTCIALISLFQAYSNGVLINTIVKVVSSAKNADAGFINKFKDDFNQQLGKTFRNGIEPSGGQWQKRV